MSKAAELASLASASETALSNRNIVINGGFTISQRNGTTLTSTLNNKYFLDRWLFYLNGSCAVSTQQMGSTDSNTTGLNTASGEVYNNVMSLDCTTAASLGSSDLLGFLQIIEGYNSVPIAGQAATLTFWVKTNITGQYYVTFKLGSARSYVAPYTVSSANTWEKKTITLTMDTLTNLNAQSTTNGSGFQVYWGLRLGTSSQQTSTINSWHDGNFYGTSSQVTWGTSTSDSFYIGGVQFEKGDTATPFEHRSFGQELALCSRYYQGTIGSGYFGVGRTANSSIMIQAPFTYEMRAVPSASLSSTTVTFAEPNLANFNCTSATIGNAHNSARGGAYYINGTMTVGVGDNVFLSTNYIKADAEL
tara:strand:- start:155 stop:1240 length:1086 start_codon:yes stop_codon:yes gene_type:complete